MAARYSNTPKEFDCVDNFRSRLISAIAGAKPSGLGTKLTRQGFKIPPSLKGSNYELANIIMDSVSNHIRQSPADLDTFKNILQSGSSDCEKLAIEMSNYSKRSTYLSCHMVITCYLLTCTVANPSPKRLHTKSFSGGPTQPVPMLSTRNRSKSADSHMHSSIEPVRNIGEETRATCNRVTLSSLSQSPSGRKHSTTGGGSGSTTKLNGTDSDGVFGKQLQVDRGGTKTSMTEGITQQVH